MGALSLKLESPWYSYEVRSFDDVTMLMRSKDETLGSPTTLCIVGMVAAVAEWYRYRTVACIVTGSSPVPLKTHRVGQRCTLHLSRAETSSRWCGVVVRRGGGSSGVVHVT
ncbi:uncharacterized protein TNCV_1160411 [Trichonephila clavipes]|nr:uncharacterized protein TNCV_1160411 [Trichonephila clavipes]